MIQLFDLNEQPLKTTKGHLKTSGKYQHINSLDICKQFEALEPGGPCPEQGYFFNDTQREIIRNSLGGNDEK